MWSKEKWRMYMKEYRDKLKEDIAAYMKEHPGANRYLAEKKVLEERKKKRWKKRRGKL